MVSDKTGIKEFLPKDLIANSLKDFVEKTVYVLEMDETEYKELSSRLRENVKDKVKRKNSVESFKSAVTRLLNKENLMEV